MITDIMIMGNILGLFFLSINCDDDYDGDDDDVDVADDDDDIADDATTDT